MERESSLVMSSLSPEVASRSGIFSNRVLPYERMWLYNLDVTSLSIKEEVLNRL